MRSCQETDEGVGCGRVNNRDLERQLEIITDGLSLDFIHRPCKHTHTHIFIASTACWAITDDQDPKLPVCLQLRISESLPSALLTLHNIIYLL